MTKTENLSDHISRITARDWNLLLGLIPGIKGSKKFGRLVGSQVLPNGSLSMPYWLETEIVSQFFNATYFLGLVVPFEWSTWREGFEMLNDPNTSFNELDTATLCRLLTIIVKGDKFCEGYMINCFETGVVVKILEALEQKVAVKEEPLRQWVA
ncbi:MAG: hypothetical protein JWO06_1486 [Bacteroidota bacterium]|nr:hypothetical protein [Bacteroidota bacterium]